MKICYTYIPLGGKRRRTKVGYVVKENEEGFLVNLPHSDSDFVFKENVLEKVREGADTR